MVLPSVPHLYFVPRESCCAAESGSRNRLIRDSTDPCAKPFSSQNLPLKTPRIDEFARRAASDMTIAVLSAVIAALSFHSPLQPPLPHHRPLSLHSPLQPPLPHHRPPSLPPRRSRPPLAIGLPAQFAPIAGLATLTAVVVIHELGHFAAARWQGIRVSEFSIGFGPPLLKRTAANGISYTLRALPIGGYVSFPRLLNRTQLEERKLLEPDEPLDPALQVEDGPDLLENRPLRERALVVGAGVVANVILSFTLLVAAAGTLGVPLPVEQPVVVSRVLPSSAGSLIATDEPPCMQALTTARSPILRSRGCGVPSRRPTSDHRVCEDEVCEAPTARHAHRCPQQRSCGAHHSAHTRAHRQARCGHYSGRSGGRSGGYGDGYGGGGISNFVTRGGSDFVTRGDGRSHSRRSGRSRPLRHPHRTRRTGDDSEGANPQPRSGAA